MKFVWCKNLALAGALALAVSPQMVLAQVKAPVEPAAKPALGRVLAPHRAVYELSLLKAEGRNAPVSAKGRIAYEFSGNACEGYTTNFRQLTEIAPAEGNTRMSDMRSNTHEAGDGKTFRFRIETFTDGQRSKLMVGLAERAGGTLSVALTQPAPLKADLADEALFPVQQTFRGMSAALAGESTAEFKVYDGSGDGKKIYHSFNIIGQPVSKPAVDSAGEQASMKGLRRWPVVASYFDMQQGDSKPAYTLSFEMWENGVSSNLRLDYGDFVLAGKLSQLEMLKASPCSPGAKPAGRK